MAGTLAARAARAATDAAIFASRAASRRLDVVATQTQALQAIALAAQPMLVAAKTFIYGFHGCGS